MNTDLRDRLDDLLTEVPHHVRADAATAWRTGARRQMRSRVLVGGGLVGVVVLIAGGLTWGGARIVQTGPADGGGSSGVPARTYPARIERPLLRTGSLPRHVGAIAGVVARPGGWYAVGQRGQLWRLPFRTNTDYLPSVSSNGERLSFVATDEPPSMVTIDLRTGEPYDDDIGPQIPPNTWHLPRHTQPFWAPDSKRVVVEVAGGVNNDPEIDAAVVRPGGLPHGVPGPGGVVSPLLAGWYDDDTLVWVKWSKNPESGTTVGSATAILADLRGNVQRRIPLHLGTVWTDLPSSASVSVSPDGGTLALGTDQGSSLSVWVFHLRGPLRGRVKAELAPSPSANPAGCPASWGDTIELPGSGYPDTILAAPGGASTIYADPRLHITCSVWSSAALSGTAYRDFTARVFDDSGTLHMGTTSWLSWHWRELVVAAVVGLVAMVVLLVWRRRRGALGWSPPRRSRKDPT
jgi:hypothetical protein